MSAKPFFTAATCAGSLLLVVYHRLLDLREVHAVQRKASGSPPAGEDARPVERLPMDQSWLQQKFVAVML